MITRETKAGLLVASSFVCLVGIVLASKLMPADAAAESDAPGSSAAQPTSAPPPASLTGNSPAGAIPPKQGGKMRSTAGDIRSDPNASTIRLTSDSSPSDVENGKNSQTNSAAPEGVVPLGASAQAGNTERAPAPASVVAVEGSKPSPSPNPVLPPPGDEGDKADVEAKEKAAKEKNKKEKSTATAPTSAVLVPNNEGDSTTEGKEKGKKEEQKGQVADPAKAQESVTKNKQVAKPDNKKGPSTGTDKDKESIVSSQPPDDIVNKMLDEAKKTSEAKVAPMDVAGDKKNGPETSAPKGDPQKRPALAEGGEPAVILPPAPAPTAVHGAGPEVETKVTPVIPGTEPASIKSAPPVIIPQRIDPIKAIEPIQPAPAGQPKILSPLVSNPRIGTPPIAASPHSEAAIAPQVESYDTSLRTVVQGDTYESISQQFYKTDMYASALRAYNAHRMSGDQPEVGKTLNIPEMAYMKKHFVGVSGNVAQVKVGRPETVLPSPAKGVDRPVLGNPIRTDNAVLPAAGEAASPTVTTYQVREPTERFWNIARDTLGDPNRWSEIYRLNPQISPEQYIPIGTVLRLPPGAQVK